ncbi:MAG: hypothetical protein JNG90_05670 [Planctomycetaceae bacterium]|nr:hypothetical protein [Planctomycetaceae bacterium]
MRFTLRVARRGARWGSVLSLVMLVGWGCETAVAAPYKGACRMEPRAIKYYHATDTILHQESGLAAARKAPPGGERAYHGNRLTQFQFIGPAGQGGIYDALKNYKERRPLDPANYKYRW